MYKVKLDGYVLYHADHPSAMLTDPVLELEPGYAGVFTATVPPDNPLYDRICCRKSMVSVFRNNREIFYGEVRKVPNIDRYDFDTAIGINNEGALVFSYNLEDIDHTESGTDIYNGQQSVLWVNVRQAFYEDIKAMYQKLRSGGTLSFAVTEQRFEEHQAKWPEAVFNEDAYFKYLQPLIEQNSQLPHHAAGLQGRAEKVVAV